MVAGTALLLFSAWLEEDSRRREAAASVVAGGGRVGRALPQEFHDPNLASPAFFFGPDNKALLTESSFQK